MKEEKLRRLREHNEKHGRTRLQRQFDAMYGWQKEFCEATAEYYECCLMAANQIGKTYTGTSIDAMHLLGEYPDDYKGHRFDFPPMCWGLGFSMEKTRDLLQKALFGEFVNGEFTGGLIPRDKIVHRGWEGAGSVKNAMRTVRVKHAKGTSIMQFWSYSQGQHAIMGDLVDWAHIDEEPEDQEIRPQVLTRLINGDKGKGGRAIYTFTPENGKTELVLQFMEDPSEDQFFMNKGWNDAPHMTPEKRERQLKLYPDYQRDMRSKGVPMLGHGRIFELSEEFITIDPFEIPDHFWVIDGMDFGWDHPQARIQLVEDRDTGTVYVTRGWKARKQSANEAWGATKEWSEGVPTAWPHDGLQHEKGRDDAVMQKEHYRKAGFLMLDEHATWEEGGYSVETGLYLINDLMRKGKFKVFSNCTGWLEEFRSYHRDKHGKIVKQRDDELDATRIAFMMRRFSVQMGNRGINRRRFGVKRAL